MMNNLVPQDLFDLAAKVAECKNQLVVVTTNEQAPEIIRALEDILIPWETYLRTAASNEAVSVFTAVKLFHTYDSTRQQVINSADALSKKITDIARAWALEQCAKCITDTFRHFNTPADIAHFSSAIDEAKNRCLTEAFGDEHRRLDELFKHVEYDLTDLAE